MAELNKMIGNYLVQQNNNFPLDCETLEYLQNNQHMAEMIGAIAGNKIILSGCEVSGSKRNKGYVFVKTTDFPQGEVLFFEGGEASHTTMYLKKESVQVIANTATFSNAYTKRSLAPGLAVRGAQYFKWNEFDSLDSRTNRELKEMCDNLQRQIENLQPAPVGSIVMWVSPTMMPNGWHECDGSSFSKSTDNGKYAQLFSALGYTFGGSGDVFKIPNMQGRFPVGYHDSDYELHQPGPGEDGEESVALTVNQMPSHNHGGSTGSDGVHNHYSDFNTYKNVGERAQDHYTRNRFARGNEQYEIQRITTNDTGDHTHTISSQGSGQAHENRPPFFVVKYIIKVE